MTTKTQTADPKKMSEQDMRALLERAHEAGMAAGRRSVPETMIVQRRADPLDDTSRILEQYVVPDGPCGFAWVTVRPANSRIAKLMKAMFDGSRGGRADRDSYAGGMALRVWEFNQSMARKEDYARAFAQTLCDAGFAASYSSRMD